ncbi:GTP-binding protein [Bacillus sp. Bva_UNVM-123]|uniref:GTP-binding protein n=1 Tax=Bacillus sp. Bva_UNVM-123 TaxID=2829798 RepID=UPI00391F2479
MEKEHQLNQKLYYESMIEGNEQHPIKLLGNLYMAEMQKEVSDLSYIRFSQGEVYFHNHDYEAAIFKWENINNELDAWAKKNIADAYFELQLHSTAEEIYKTVQTDSAMLQTEVLLQLFSLYIEQGKHEEAVVAIKRAVDLNPDYPDVTVLARAYFEKHHDWDNAIELAINEAVRTEELSWFNILQTYVEQGYTKRMEPNVFNQTLVSLYRIDYASFESLTAALWNSYKVEESYFAWLKEINYILMHLERSRTYSWQQLSTLYKDTYFELINGKNLIKEISHLIPNHITNWMKVASKTDALIAATSTLSWYEIFMSNLDPEIVNEAESIIRSSARYDQGLTDGYHLFTLISEWAKKNGVELGKRFEWIVSELLDTCQHHLLITGAGGNGKKAVIRSLVGESNMNDSVTTSILYKNHDEMELREVTDEGIKEISALTNIDTTLEAIVYYQNRLSFLKENGLALIDTPIITGRNKFKNGVLQYLPLADSLLFVLDREELFSERELDIVVKIREQAPGLPIHFLINVQDSEQELYDLAASRVNTYFPKAKVFAYSGQLGQLQEMTKYMKGNRNLEEERTSKVLQYIRKTIKFLLERRVEIENGMVDSIKRNEDMVVKLTGATNQVIDLEEEKVRLIKRSFSEIKNEMREVINEEIPKLLHDCSAFVNEDSDFGKVHLQLNDEMNKRVQSYMNDSAMLRFHRSFQNWIEEAKGEFEQAQYFLSELSGGLNDLYEEEKLMLECDFKVLDDWKRDADRLTRGNIHVDKMNILLRFTPSQFLLKSAGKIFGALQQNKALLHKKYKQYIESEDYSEVAARLADEFLQPYVLFEKALDRDINIFFQNPLSILQETIDATNQEIKLSKEELQEMRVNPESYRDPLTLFQVKLLQFEWMTKAGKEVKQYR